MSTRKTLEELQKVIEFAKEELGEGFLASDISSIEGLPVIEGYNSNPTASALFANITEYIKKVVEESNFPNLSDYYIVNLEGNRLVLLIFSEEFEWGMLIDYNKIKLGYLFSIFLPEAIKRFKEATKVR